MKITKVKTITEIITYHLTKEVKYIKVITNTNGKETKRFLNYTGKQLYEYDLKPIYDKDISILKKHNPCWGNTKDFKEGYSWLENTNLPEPEDIDINKIIYYQFARHAFFTLDKKPLPVVVSGDYIEAHLNNKFYDLVKLRKYLLKHKNVSFCSDILDIPYYNRGESGEIEYLSVLVYPTKEILQKGYDTKQTNKDVVFHKPYNPDSEDFLGIKKFVINTEY